MPITVRVHDVTHGRPAGGVDVGLERFRDGSWTPVARTRTDEFGVVPFEAWGQAGSGSHRVVVDSLRFHTLLGICAAQAEVSTVVRVSEPTAEHHLTVLLAPSACVMHLDGPRS